MSDSHEMDYYYFGLGDDRVLHYPPNGENLRSVRYDDGGHSILNDFSRQMLEQVLFGKRLILDERSLVQQPGYLATANTDSSLNLIETLAAHGRIKLLSDDGDLAGLAAKLYREQKTTSMAGLDRWLSRADNYKIRQGLEQVSAALDSRHHIWTFPKAINERDANRKLAESTVERFAESGELGRIVSEDLFPKEAWEKFGEEWRRLAGEGVSFRTAWEDAAKTVCGYSISDTEGPRQDPRVRGLMNFVNEARHKSYAAALRLDRHEEIGAITTESTRFAWFFSNAGERWSYGVEDARFATSFGYAEEVILNNFSDFCEHLFDARTELGKARIEFLKNLKTCDPASRDDRLDLDEATSQYEIQIDVVLKKITGAKHKPSILRRISVGVISEVIMPSATTLLGGAFIGAISSIFSFAAETVMDYRKVKRDGDGSRPLGPRRRIEIDPAIRSAVRIGAADARKFSEL